MAAKEQRSIKLENVRIKDEFWSDIQRLITDVVIPYQADILEDKVPGAEKSHAVENFKIAAGESSGEFYGMVFQDSDVAKWLEAAAYSLSFKPDAGLEAKADEIIALIGRAQQEDGYLNTYFTVKELEHRWENLMECHELYCAGHLMEAAVAYYEVTGKAAFLDIMQKYADLICSRFGKDRVRGVPGHQEIELALLRMYKVTGKKEYLETAKYFLDERGTEPDFFEEEKARLDWEHFGMKPENKKYAQTFAPVRDQSTAEGHSVRAVYMYTAMADLAAEIGDKELQDACVRLWKNIVEKRMYVTGGIGSTHHGEAFTIDYDLPNDTIYAETCASVGMVFFARRMLEMDVRGEYADIMEKELYNGVLSGMQLDGKRFFYVNPLEVVPGVSGELEDFRHVLPVRPGWYACACCPPNVARLMTSLGGYAWGENDTTVYSHLFMGGSAKFNLAGGVEIDAVSEYPWKGEVSYTINPKQRDTAFTFAVHKPIWCKAWTLTVNGTAVMADEKDGYAYIIRSWNEGDRVSLEFDMPAQRLYSNVNVRENIGCTALCRGPVVYAFEEADNGKNLAALELPADAEITTLAGDGLLSRMVLLKADGVKLNGQSSLYTEKRPDEEPAVLTAVPYYAWGNRGTGEMRVWIHEK